MRHAVLSGALPPGRTFSTAELSAQLGVSHIPVRLRQLIEPDLASRSVSMLREGDIQQANELLNGYIHGSDNIDELWEYHHDLHLALLRPAASEWDLRILSQLWHASDRYTRLVFDPYAVSAPDQESREAAHRALLAAARSGSPAEIRRAVSEHLSDNEAACLERIASLASSTPSHPADPH